MRTTLVVAAAAFAITASSSRAQECGFPLESYQKPLVAQLDTQPVRAALAERDYARAATAARAQLKPAKIMREMRGGGVSYDVAFGEEEVRASLAIAVIRSQGRLAVTSTKTAAKPKAMQKNLKDALALLENELTQSPGDPVLATYLAEGSFASGDLTGAREMLEDLAASDLIVSPEGWAALAQLRTDANEADAASARCAAMSDDASVCAVKKVARS